MPHPFGQLAEPGQYLDGPQGLQGISQSFPFPARADKQQQELVVADVKRRARRGAIALLKPRHVHAVSDEMNPLRRKGEVRQDFFSDHVRVDDDMAGVARVKRLGFETQHVAVKRAQPNEWPAPPGRILTPALQPDPVHAVSSPVHILSPRALQAEHTIEVVPGQFAPHRVREHDRPARARRPDPQRMQSHAGWCVVPGFREKVQLVASFCQDAEQSPQIKLRAAGGGKTAANERKFHNHPGKNPSCTDVSRGSVTPASNRERSAACMARCCFVVTVRERTSLPELNAQGAPEPSLVTPTRPTRHPVPLRRGQSDVVRGPSSTSVPSHHK